MTGYSLKLAAIGAAILIAGGFALYFFTALWARIGLGVAIAIVIGGLLFIAWRIDQRDKAARACIDELPRV